MFSFSRLEFAKHKHIRDNRIVTFIDKYMSNVLLVLFGCIPIFIWLESFGLSNATANLGTSIASLGKAVALCGTTLYCLNPILSARLRVLEKLYGGLDKLTKVHIASGKIAFWLIILHPVFLGLGRYLKDTPLSHIWDWSSLVIFLGIGAFFGLIFVTGMSIYAHVTHQKWIWVHRFFGWLIPLFFLHGLLARGQITKIPLLFVFFGILGTAGFIAFLYRSVVWKKVIRRYQYEIAEINRLNPTVAELVLRTSGQKMHYEAGQYAYASFDAIGVDPEPHPFSFSNAHNGPYIRFTIKALGDDTKRFMDLQPGTAVQLEGPYGRFSYKNVKNRSQVWIAGGIGITPFLSMARSFSGTEEYDIRFYYGTESLDEAVFLNEFIDITRHLPENFATSVVAKNFSGFVTVDMLKNSLADLRQFDYLICGPPPMVKALTTQLQKAGVPLSQMHFEAFSFR